MNDFAASPQEILARWQALAELQSRALRFLATETLATGQDFENSTAGATDVLVRIGQFAGESESGELQVQTGALVQRLQNADRSRQGLEQVASVLLALEELQKHLADITRPLAPSPDADSMQPWIAALSGPVTLGDWRRRLEDALNGRPSPPSIIRQDDVELF